MNTDRTLLNKARVLLGLEVKLEQMKLDNGAILEAEVFEAGAEMLSLSLQMTRELQFQLENMKLKVV